MRAKDTPCLKNETTTTRATSKRNEIWDKSKEVGREIGAEKGDLLQGRTGEKRGGG